MLDRLLELANLNAILLLCNLALMLLAAAVLLTQTVKLLTAVILMCVHLYADSSLMLQTS